MLRTIDATACSNPWRHHSEAVALLCAGLFAVALVAPVIPGTPIVLLAACGLCMFGARVSARAYLRALAVPLGFLLIGAFGIVWSVRLDDGFHFAYSAEGFRTAWHSVLRAWAASAVMLLFAFTVPIPQLIALLRRLRTPEALLDLMLLTYRTLFVLDRNRAALLLSQRNRLGYRNARTALRSVAQAAAALFVRALVQSIRLERGLGARGYQGRLVVLMPPSATRAPHLALAFAFPALLGAIAWFCATRLGMG